MSSLGSLLPLIGLTLLGVALGVVLMVVARRARRVDDHPTCGRCRFDLVGLGDRAQACPECGGVLTGWRAIRVGNRRANKRLMGVGIVVVLLCLGAGGAAMAVQLAGNDINKYKPAWLLVREARTGGPADRSEAIGFRSPCRSSGSLSI